MIQPYLENSKWHTSITLAKQMYISHQYWNKEIARVSSILSKLYHNTNLLIRKPRARIYFHNIHKAHTSTFAYMLNPDLIKESEYKA